MGLSYSLCCDFLYELRWLVYPLSILLAIHSYGCLSVRSTILGSLCLGMVLAGVVFKSVISVSVSLYVVLVVALTIYVLSLFLSLKLSLNFIHYAAKIAALFFFVGVVEILVSLSGWPLSFSVLFIDVPLYRSLLPYVGSEISFSLLVVLAFVGQKSKALFFGFFLLLFVSFEGIRADIYKIVNVALLQTNLSQEVVSFPGLSGNFELWENQISDLRSELESSNANLIVFPESAMLGYGEKASPLVVNIISNFVGHLVLSHHYVDEPQRGLVSMVKLWGKDGTLLGRHEKTSLIPFVEDELVAGVGGQFYLEGTDFSVFVCSEIFNVYSTRASLASSGFGVSVINGASVFDSVLPELHLNVERVRSLESHKSIVRSSNSGFTASIDYNGNILSSLPVGKVGIIETAVSVSDGSFFSKWYLNIHATFFIGFFIFLLLNRNVFQYRSAGVCIFPRLSFFVLFLAPWGLYKDSNLSRESPYSIHYPADSTGFAFRQLGVSSRWADEYFENYLKKEVISSPDYFLSSGRGVAVIRSMDGLMHIIDRDGGYFIVEKQGRISRMTIQELEDVRVSEFLWISYL